MRRTVGLFAAALCLLLSACGGGEAAISAEAETACTPSELMEAVKQRLAQTETLPALESLTPEDEGFGEYLTAYYQLAPEEVADGILCCASGTEAVELAILHLTEEADMEAAETALLAYQEHRAGDFTGYLPEQAALVEEGLVVLQGRWAALLLCPAPETAREELLRYFGPDAPPPPAAAEPVPGEPLPQTPAFPEQAPETPRSPEAPEELPASAPAEPSAAPEAPQPLEPAAQETPPAPPAGDYDREAVLAAWRSGDASGLSGKSQAVLEAARAALEEAVTGEMNEYEKELAIHDWMLAWGQYDHGTLSHLPQEQAGQDNDNPYGFLVEKTGICLGYASTFQLFMDLLGVECITVEGTAHSGTADHAWNLVQLDGAWYGVDVTWDDPSTKIPVSEETAHRYFNVISAFLRDNDHQWEEDGVPEATGTVWGWQP